MKITITKSKTDQEAQSQTIAIPRRYAGRSYRRGFLTSAAKKRRDLLKMAEQSRHKSLEVVRQYIEDEGKFDDHTGEDLVK